MITTKALRLTTQQSSTLVQSLIGTEFKDCEEFQRNIAKHNSYQSFASDTQQISTSGQSLIGTEL